VQNHNAIKVGFGESSTQRMTDYSKSYLLEVKYSSLRSWEIPVSGLAQIIENSCHKALVEAGLKKHIVTNINGQESQELFQLGSTSYDEAVLIVASTIDETIDNILSKFGDTKNKNNEESRRKKEENKLRKENIVSAKKVEFDKQVLECSFYIKSVWDSKFQPVIEIFEKTRKINVNFEYKETRIKRFFSGEINPVIRMYQWQPYQVICNHIENSLEPLRAAKAEYLKIKSKFPDYKVISASEKCLKLSIYRPGEYDLPFVDNPHYRNNWALTEVRLVVQMATYCFDGDQALELIKLDSRLQKLVSKAYLNYPPELLNKN
jgi:hypothetical protein